MAATPDGVPTVAVKRRCWRVLAPGWAGAPLSGAGSARNGGRFNEPGVDALYLSEDLMCAVAEYQQEIGVRPGTFCAYDLDVAPVVDVTDPAVRAACGVTMDDLHCPWKSIALVEKGRPPTWDLAARLISAGHAGVRAPSVMTPQGINIILWCWNDDPSRTVTVLDPGDDLP
jgi:RES domain-containing protein